jgi:YVTN family beta-propeller protein
VGVRPRTVAVSPDGRRLYAAVHGSGTLVMVDAVSWRVAASAEVSRFPVGLGVSPDGSYVAVTSQGAPDPEAPPPGYSGGNSVEVFRVR